MVPKGQAIVVIGCGPAGMFAAIKAAEILGKGSVLILDANMKPGRKLSVTGNGRCNLTNADAVAESGHYHGRNPRFVNGLLSRFSNSDLLEYFGSLGVEFRLEEGGKYFPVTDQAASITDNLVLECERHGVEIRLQSRVISVERTGSNGFLVSIPSGVVECRVVIVATGGMSYPRLGACGDGYAIARSFGHTIIEPKPVLTGFETLEKKLFDLQGVQITAEVSCGKRKVRGEVMFTHYGLSGPAVFDLSPFLVRDPGEEWIAMDFFPDQTSEDLDAKIREIWSNNPGRTLGNSLIGILPKKFAQVLVRNVLGADIGTPVADVGKETRRKLVAMLKHLTVKLKGPRGWDEAQATAGGILTDEIDPRTMESNKCPGLYFCGEVLDIDGDCGGYNLQFAFSSGFAAGTAAAKVLSG